ncbi:MULTISPECIES: lysophospholipid acyltransferase family protein [Micrococcaceae]|jgi:1-acyl-sn-glycerol-3-phosphate acyltransferase|uniref:lysophospholipid acyltransferase family protein n=1 Tax=Micrococcaceae TaxID=1268 RepID=UPI0012FA865D|nr:MULTISPECIES: lysophospholipid acyltransferase family protein [Pseudarthrobacter]MEA3551209.1 lysophospholipid acyltransferase family protein [Pseudarthrobacter sp. C1]WPU11342.1 lysophospholipid acyltransferase family protein [Pseudarthrobacter oxydans]HET7783161.1 lysophospholipid acyltransferase family protein [Arthrobacter sp.]
MTWSRPVGWILDHLVYRTTVTGKDNVPTGGPVIFAANHISFLDGPVMFGASPRPMHILVKQEMFQGFLGRVLNASGQLPVDRRGDRAALQRCKEVLDAGRCVGILPEGTRGSGAAADINGGVAWLALNSGAPVVPVAILGTRRGDEHLDSVPRPGRRFHVSFGNALTLGRRAGESGRASMDRAALEIRAALAGHVQDSVQLSGQPLPTADAHKDLTAVAGTPADDH